MTDLLIRVLTAGGELAEAVVRAAAHHTTAADHVDVRLLLDLRWLEPLSADADFLATHFVPEEEDPAIEVFLQELDEKLESFRTILAESPATYTARRVLGMPDEAIAQAGRGADLLMLPHPSGASAVLRKAIHGAVAAPPVPLFLVAYPETVQVATVQSEAPAGGINGSHVLLGSVLGGKVNRIAVDPGTPAESFRSLAPLVEETHPSRARVEGQVDPEEMYVVLHATRAKGMLGARATARKRLAPPRNLLLIPARS